MESNDLRRSIAELSPAKRALLERRLLTKCAAETPAIPRRDVAASYPLSFGQQRLWFLDRLEPESAVYNIARAVHLRGALQVEALRQALDAIVARHEALRTTFAAVDGVPLQRIGAPRAVDMTVIDLTAGPAAERSAALRRLLDEQARRPFDLARDLMLRATLFRLGEAEYALLLTTHHIASDGWSMSVLFRELTDLYAAFGRGAPSALPPLSIQYADYAVWQRQQLHGERLEAQLGYWRRRLAGAPAALELPTDRQRPTVQSLRGAHVSSLLPGPLVERLKEMSRREGVTLFMTLLAGFQALLHRYTGQEDILVGSPIAGRTRPELEGLIGFFVNTLVLRTDLSGEPTFRGLLARVRESALGAYGHQELPFEKLVEELQPERSSSYSPLCQVMFAFQNIPTSTLSLAGLTSSPLTVDTGTSKFDLTLSVETTEGGLTAMLEYNTDLFDAATMDRMLGHWRRLLEAAVLDPDERVSRLRLVTDAERQQLLVAWNDTGVEYPRRACLHELFEAQVARTPDAVAVSGGGQSLTYRELNGLANRVAHVLRERGVGPDVLVGLCVERSPLMMQGLLGVLKAGGAYVPLDPAYPKDRLAFILADARPTVIVTQRRLLGSLPESATPIVLCLDADGEATAAPSENNPASGATADSVAYVIYTSGSTGQPKGVLGLHRGAVNRFAWMWRTYPFTPADVCCQKTSLNFVDSVWEVLGPLLAGIPTHIVPDDVVGDPRRLVQCLADQRVSRIVLVPSLLRVLLDTDMDLARLLPGLTLWICSGEALSRELADRFRERMPHSVLLNLYGSSEVSADATWYDTRHLRDHLAVPVGRPIDNTQVYLLDRHLEPVPVGVSGELYVGGDGLARGYLDRPELTAEKFVANPFAIGPGARLYRTGDLARYHPDGTIEFLGRADHQVKIRGFRIELGEIEAALGSHPAVGESLVLTREDLPGEARLVAYLVPRSAPAPTSEELRRFLGEKLPHYMVPSVFVTLERLPLTPNGKVDRRTLPAPGQARPDSAAAFAAPRDPLAVQVTAIWETVLGVRGIGLRDNFFDLGGHSLLAVRLFARIEEGLGRRLPVATLFRAPTVEQLTRALREDGLPAARWSSLVAIQPAGDKPPLFCVHPHVGHVLCYYDLARMLGAGQPVYGLQALALDGTQAFSTLIEDIAAHYTREIRELQPEGPYRLAGYCFGGVVAFEMARQLQAQGHAVALLALLDPGPPGRRVTFFGRVRRLRRQIALDVSKLAGLPSGKLLRAVRRRANRLGTWIAARTARALGREAPIDRAIRRTQEAHLRGLRAYVPRPYAGPVTLFLSPRPPVPNGDLAVEWKPLAAGGLSVCEIGGAQADILGQPRVRALAAELLRHLGAEDR